MKQEHQNPKICDKPVFLIVDDDEMNLEMAKSLLKLKYDAAEYLLASSGRECLRLLQERGNEIRLILLDVLMPEMDGVDTLAEIRKNNAWLSIPVVFLTAEADTATIVRASQYGMQDYVLKPFGAQEFWERIGKCLAEKE